MWHPCLARWQDGLRGGPLSFAVSQGLRLTQKLCHIQQVVSKIILGININNSLRARTEKVFVLLYHFGLEVTTSSMPHSVGQDSGKWKMSFLTGQPFLHRNATLWKENMNLWRTAGFLTTAVNWLYDLSDFLIAILFYYYFWDACYCYILASLKSGYVLQMTS